MGIETALLLGSAGFNAYGAYSNSKATKTAYDAQGQIAANNAQIATWQAEDAIVRGDREASRSRLKTRQLKGSQRAALAANGVDLGEGSALNILADTDYFGELDAGTIKDNAAREAWAIRNQATNFTSEGSLLRSRADMESPVFAASTSLLTGANRVASHWYSQPRKTVPTYPGAEY